MAASKNKQELVKKYFTVKEAERLLPKVQKILVRTISLNKALDLLSSIELEVFDDDHHNIRKVTKLNKEFHKLSYEFYRNIEELEEMGCVIKDLELGVVDFYSIHENREIFLCWKLGEQKIEFYHEIEDGFPGRQPLSKLNKK